MAARSVVLAGRLMGVFTVLGLLVHAAGLLGGWHWLLDLCSHFQPPLALMALVFLVLAVVIGRRAVAFANAGLLVLTLPGLVPLYRAEAPPTGERLEILAANVNCHHGDPPQVIDLLEKSTADIVGLLEIDERWMVALEPALRRWPHRIVHPYEGTFGLGLFSRRPIEGAVIDRDVLAVPAIRARIDLGGQLVGLLLVHVPPPVTGAIAAKRDRDLGLLGRLRAELGERVIVMGDFNATPWSVPFRQFLEVAGLHESRDLTGAGIGGTWPAQLPGFLRIPIDHILVGGGLGVAEFEVGPATGSDHRPVRAVVGSAP